MKEKDSEMASCCASGLFCSILPYEHSAIFLMLLSVWGCFILAKSWYNETANMQRGLFGLNSELLTVLLPIEEERDKVLVFPVFIMPLPSLGENVSFFYLKLPESLNFFLINIDNASERFNTFVLILSQSHFSLFSHIPYVVCQLKHFN